MATVNGIPPPMSAAQAFETALRRMILRPAIRQLEARVALAGDSYRSIMADISGIGADPALAGLSASAARAHMKRLERYHNARLRRQMRRHFGVRVDFMSDHNIRPILDQAISDNVDLIKTIPPRLHAGVKADLTKLAEDKPFDQHALADVLSKNYQSAGYNLRRLARDQTTKTIGKLTEIRQGELGITEYIWQTSEDERVRDTHQANNRKTFAWSAPPPTGHPGADIQCRCVAIAIIPRQEKHEPQRPYTIAQERAQEAYLSEVYPRFAGKLGDLQNLIIDDTGAGDHWRRLTAVEFLTVRDYTAQGHRKVNSALLEKARGNPPEDMEKWEAYSAIANAALAKADKSVGVVTRGFDPRSAAAMDRYKVGEVIEEPALLSTARGDPFPGAVQMTIKQKSGVYVDEISAQTGEKEVLVPSGTKFRVLEVTTEGSGRHQRWEIRMEEVDAD